MLVIIIVIQNSKWLLEHFWDKILKLHQSWSNMSYFPWCRLFSCIRWLKPFSLWVKMVYKLIKRFECKVSKKLIFTNIDSYIEFSAEVDFTFFRWDPVFAAISLRLILPVHSLPFPVNPTVAQRQLYPCKVFVHTASSSQSFSSMHWSVSRENQNTGMRVWYVVRLLVSSLTTCEHKIWQWESRTAVSSSWDLWALDRSRNYALPVLGSR